MTEKKITFEELYANPYIQESVNSTTAAIVKIHPRLQMFDDDIRQDLWLQINAAIPNYSPEGKATPETFFRHAIDLRKVNIAERYLHLAGCSIFAMEAMECILMTMGANTVTLENQNLRRDLDEVMEKLTPKQRFVCELIMAGQSFKTICNNLHISQSFLKKGYILPIRKKFIEAKLDQYLYNH